MDTDVEDFLLESVASICNVARASLCPETRVADAGLDSMNLVAVIGLLESEFGVQVTAQQVLDAFAAVTLGDLVRFVQKMRSETA